MMFMMNIPASAAKYAYEAQMKMGENIAEAVKRYWKENVKEIAAGLASLNGGNSFNLLCVE